MRIGLQTPRINGVGILITPEQLVQQDLQSYLMNIDYSVQQGIAVTPSQLAGILQQEVNAVCRNWPDQCGNVDSAIAAAVAVYTDAYATAKNKAYEGAQNNTIALPLPPTYYTPVYTIQSQPNALDTSAPVQTVVNPTVPQNSLQPPQQTMAPMGTNAGSFTGTGTQSTVPGPGFDLNQTVSIGSLDVPMWGLIAAGVGVLLLMRSH